MQTPGTNPKAQPEIQFLGGVNVSASRPSRDPAVTAAFLAFHRNTGGAGFLAPGKSCISRGALALAALAILGFGGGLFLAIFSFNTPEGSSSPVAARPPEVIYTARMATDAPQDAVAAPEYAATNPAVPIAAPVFALAARDEGRPDTSIWRDSSSGSSRSFGDSYASAGTQAFAGINEAMAPAEGPNGAASDITTGFDALTAAPVPEPSTWATMISGAGLLVLASRFKRGRG